MKKSFALSIALGAVISALSATAHAQPSEHDVIKNIADTVIIGNYQHLESNMKSLAQAIAALKSHPTAEQLLATQNAWREARVGFEIAEAHLFGPVVSLAIDPALDSWPLDSEQLQQSIQTAAALDQDKLTQYVNQLNDDVSGYHALEFVLFGDNNQRKISDISPAELAYLLTLTERLVKVTEGLSQAWLVTADQKTAFVDQLLQPKSGQIYADNKAILQELVNGMITIIDEVGTGKLIDPLSDSIATANPAMAESGYSWNSSTDFFWNIAGVKQVWMGQSYINQTEKSNNTLGLYDLVVEKNPELAQKVSKQINQALIDIVNISFDQYTHGASALQKTEGDVNQLYALISRDDYSLAYREQIKTNSGRKKIRRAEASLDLLKATLEKEVLVFFETP